MLRNKLYNRVALLAILFLLTLSVSTTWAEDTVDESMIRKTLAVNRRLLAGYQTQAKTLRGDHMETLSASIGRRLKNLRYQIKTLRRDSSKLSASLSAAQQAREFLKDLIVSKAAWPKTPAEAPASAPPSNEQKIFLLHQQALQLTEEDRLDEAAKLYEQIVLIDPDDDQAYLIMGHSYLLSGNFEKAADAFKNAVHIDPENEREILPFYENLVLKNPNDDMTQSNLGYACLVLGDTERAKDAFKDALQINPQNSMARAGLKGLEGRVRSVVRDL